MRLLKYLSHVGLVAGVALLASQAQASLVWETTFLEVKVGTGPGATYDIIETNGTELDTTLLMNTNFADELDLVQAVLTARNSDVTVSDYLDKLEEDQSGTVVRTNDGKLNSSGTITDSGAVGSPDGEISWDLTETSYGVGVVLLKDGNYESAGGAGTLFTLYTVTPDQAFDSGENQTVQFEDPPPLEPLATINKQISHISFFGSEGDQGGSFPVPEPASMAVWTLMTLAGLGIVGHRRRQ